MTTFLFWNIKKKLLQDMIADIALHHKVDIIILAESIIKPNSMLSVLNELGKSDKTSYHYVPKNGECNIQIYTKFPTKYLENINECNNRRMAIYRLKLPGLTEILLAVAHLPSKFNWESKSQAQHCPKFSEKILLAEEISKHSRTVFVGDLNMNPFEDGLISAGGFHAVMSRMVAGKKKRTVMDDQFKFFYNPMWSFFGESTHGPSGTYFHYSSEPLEYFWHILDQVLIRPDLLDRFDDKDVEILKSAGNASLLTKEGIPDDRIASDHLPVLFRLML